MEGDAGTSRLNPTDDENASPEVAEPADEPAAATDPAPEPDDAGRSSRRGRGWLRRRRTPPLVAGEPPAVDETADEPPAPAVDEPPAPAVDETADEPPAPAVDETADEPPAPAVDEAADESAEAPTPAEPVGAGHPSRVGRGWLIGVATVLLIVGAGVAGGGYFALRAHRESVASARADVAAVQAAKDCVAATHAPNTAAMVAAQQKIVDCSTGGFGAEAALYGGVLVEAYQAADVQVQVSDIRAAVEKHNDDGSIEVLVAVRTKVSNTAAQDQEQGYRLRVQMAPVNGGYRIAKLDQVSS